MPLRYLALALFATACVPASALRAPARATAEAQGVILSALDELDDMCQRKASDAAERTKCRQPRDRIMAALRDQVDAWAGVTK